jgi:hypothetical protein
MYLIFTFSSKSIVIVIPFKRLYIEKKYSLQICLVTIILYAIAGNLFHFLGYTLFIFANL